ncbi:winged helix-turn-helix domain-containing protein [Jannaschia formosa]|uniref:winged helix-turn-helix domain-containing protein n=1 Tax=Jannaschia formosa TaxID=2259592 RepID=UPI000E1B6DE1|nr:crosslink repair DNA glycosylase YcaQ family protein [Jannaschia formosa]TFL20180.1 winged helix-turn-helix domain-containing protein [Jannaschia formosa]
MTAPRRLDNRAARALFLARHGLAEPPSGPGRGADLAGVIDRLGFVQLDSIATVARAQHMILHARRTAYRAPALATLHDRDRGLFEHWTHDASILPMRFFPYWRLKFARYADPDNTRWRHWHDTHEGKLDEVLERIARDGPCSSSDVGADEARGSGGWWEWHPSKAALEYLWRCGRLTVVRRQHFRKVYDLTENVVPPEYLNAFVPDDEVIDWACGAALDRLGFATPGELAAFWELVTPAEARHWCDGAARRGEIVPAEIACADGRVRRVWMRPDALDEVPPEAPRRMRVLSPFDPALRDRKRAERLFGFHYRIEIFVPEAQRRYGYYVFPLLEGDRLVGRIDMKAERDADRLAVRALWPERGARFGAGRIARLEAALERTARLAGVARIAFAEGWLRDPR